MLIYLDTPKQFGHSHTIIKNGGKEVVKKICPLINKACIEEKCDAYELKIILNRYATYFVYDKTREIINKPLSVFDHYKGFWPLRKAIYKEIKLKDYQEIHVIKTVHFYDTSCDLIPKKGFKPTVSIENKDCWMDHNSQMMSLERFKELKKGWKIVTEQAPVAQQG